MVGIDHEDGTGWASILADKSLGCRESAALELLGVVDDGPHELEPASIVLHVRANLNLEVVETACDRLTANKKVSAACEGGGARDGPSKPGNLLVAIPKPSNRSRVGRVALLLDPCEPLGLASLLRAKKLEGLGRGDGVGDV